MRRLILAVVIFSMLVTACAGTVGQKTPLSTPIPIAPTTEPKPTEVMVGDSVPEQPEITETFMPPTVTVIKPPAVEVPTPPVTTPTPPISYLEYQIEDGSGRKGTIQVWQLKDESAMMAVAPMAITLAAVDGPIPLGDTIAIVMLGTTVYVLSASSETALNPALNPELPQVPEIDWPGIMHAAQQRAWPLMFTIIAYAYVKDSPDMVFYGPTSGRLLILRIDAIWGVIGLVFAAPLNAAPPNILPDADRIPVANGLITILYDRSNNIDSTIDRYRRSDCASWKLYPGIDHDPNFEPPPIGRGRCLENGNVVH
jgi:hypothetical protein